MDENIIDSEIEEDDLNDTLYKIKELKFDVKEIKNKLGLEIEIYKKYEENYQIVLLKGKYYDFFPQSRMMQFIEGKNVTEKFIYSSENLIETLQKLKFNLFTVDEKEKYFDSIESEIGTEEINSIFENESIIKITKITSELETIINKYKKRFPKNNKVRYISDLSLNSSSYYPENKDDEINFQILANYPNIIRNFFASNRNILYFVGPKGVSKSIYLLNFCFEFNLIKNIPLLYINYREIIKLTTNKKKNLFKKEML